MTISDNMEYYLDFFLRESVSGDGTLTIYRDEENKDKSISLNRKEYQIEDDDRLSLFIMFFYYIHKGLLKKKEKGINKVIFSITLKGKLEASYL
jgi:hypothetical protein